jgi:hypothetical protein
MKSILNTVYNKFSLRISLAVVALVILLFLLPAEGKVEGSSINYWNGVWLRLFSVNFCARSLLCGLGFAILLVSLTAFALYSARFADAPSGNDHTSK